MARRAIVEVKGRETDDVVENAETVSVQEGVLTILGGLGQTLYVIPVAEFKRITWESGDSPEAVNP